MENSFYFEPVKCISICIPRVFESHIIKVKTGKNKYILLCNIYHPNSALHANIKYLDQTISDISSKIKSNPNFKNVHEAGNMDINLLKHTNHINTGLYLDTLIENSFLPLITLPTRIAGSSATLLDHIVINIADDAYD